CLVIGAARLLTHRIPIAAVIAVDVHGACRVSEASVDLVRALLVLARDARIDLRQRAHALIGGACDEAAGEGDGGLVLEPADLQVAPLGRVLGAAEITERQVPAIGGRGARAIIVLAGIVETSLARRALVLQALHIAAGRRGASRSAGPA